MIGVHFTGTESPSFWLFLDTLCQITIESIFNEHFAKAKITSSEVEKHNVVELELRGK